MNNTSLLKIGIKSKQKNIISASRRTDIPAFYGEWFFEQVKQGFAKVRNPFSGKYSEISLELQDVGAIVFWSKNYLPFLPILDKIDSIYEKRFVFHFTITGFSAEVQKILEPFVPHSSISIKTAKILAERYDADKVLWRFDPIIFSNLSLFEERLETFSKLADSLEGFTRRCYISFIDLYGKVKMKLDNITNSGKMNFIKPAINEQVEFAKRVKEIALEHGIQVFTCCEDTIGRMADIPKGHCIDAVLLSKLFPEIQFTDTIHPTRKECG
ncbi:MAG: DUF1848 family protein, partial [Candidatus Marinimicrobia bacterium]|nr:DUF1848 family protein [Candidatus Neomarinimicrobiota bacterium]